MARTIKTVKTTTTTTTVETIVRTVKVRRAARKADPGGYVVYRGPSMITGAPIVVVATLKTSNKKTGPMIQVWILSDEMSPIEASQRGKDDSICGNCAFRGIATLIKGKGKGKGKAKRTAKGRSCYVNLGQAPSAVWNGLKRGIYPTADASMVATFCKGRTVRLGAYGDPLAVPIGVLQTMVDASIGHTGYTHSWLLAHADAYRHIVVASVQNEADATMAEGMGWRYFRVRRDSDPVLANEVICPASDEAGHKRDCHSCLACDGADRPGKRSIVIIGHGGIAVKANVARALDILASN